MINELAYRSLEIVLTTRWVLKVADHRHALVLIFGSYHLMIFTNDLRTKHSPQFLNLLILHEVDLLKVLDFLLIGLHEVLSLL